MRRAPDYRLEMDRERVGSVMIGACVLVCVFCRTFFALVPSLHAQIQSTPLTTWAVTIVLPPKLMAGHPATLAVLGVDGKLASNVTVDLGKGQTVKTDRTGRAFFTVPATGDYLLAKASGASVAALIDRKSVV